MYGIGPLCEEPCGENERCIRVQGHRGDCLPGNPDNFYARDAEFSDKMKRAVDEFKRAED